MVRPIRASDRERLVRLFARLSPQTRYRRFLAPKQRLTETELDALTVLDHHAREAPIALDSDGRLVGGREFVASCLADNRDMITLFRELGDSVRLTGQGAGTVDLEIPLPS